VNIIAQVGAAALVSAIIAKLLINTTLNINLVAATERIYGIQGRMIVGETVDSSDIEGREHERTRERENEE
jgi:hypothetical protein